MYRLLVHKMQQSLRRRVPADNSLASHTGGKQPQIRGNRHQRVVDTLILFSSYHKGLPQNVCDKHVINTTRKKNNKNPWFFFLFFLLFKLIPRAFRRLCHAQTWASLGHSPVYLPTAASLSAPQPPHLCLQNSAARRLSIQVLITELPHPEKDRVHLNA